MDVTGASDDTGATDTPRLTAVVERTHLQNVQVREIRGAVDNGDHHIAVSGTPGSGRATIVDGAVDLLRSRFQLTVVSRAANAGELELDIRDQLAAQGVDCHADVRRTVRRALGTRGRMLLAVVDAPGETVAQYLPKRIDGVVITAGDASGPVDTVIDVEPLESREVASFIKGLTDQQPMLTDLPQVAVLPGTVRALLRADDRPNLALLGELLDEVRHASPAQHLTLLLNRLIDGLQAHERQLLSAACLFGPGVVADELLTASLAPGRDLQRNGGLTAVAAALVDVGLVRVVEDGIAVRPATLATIKADGMLRPQEKLVRRAQDATSQLLDRGEPDEGVVRSALRLLHNSDTWLGVEASIDFRRRCADLLADRGAHATAEVLFGRVIEQTEAKHGEISIESADARNDRGLIRAEQADLEGAVEDFEAALAVLETGGAKQPHTKALILANLGRSLASLRRHPEALAAFEQSGALFRQADGDWMFHEAMVQTASAASYHHLRDDRRSQGALRRAGKLVEGMTDSHAAGVVSDELGRITELVGRPGVALSDDPDDTTT